MRGSIYYQTSVLAKMIFKSHLKKSSKIDKTSPYYQHVSAYDTMESYRKIWNNLGHYVYDIYGIKDFEKITQDHIIKFMYEKIFLDISHQYLQKISSALGKLEVVLNKFSMSYNTGKTYDFSQRIQIVKEAKTHELTNNNYRDRAYADPRQIIAFLEKPKHQLAAAIQLHSGTRAQGICLIKKQQLKGYDIDSITGMEIGIVKTKEKGGKVGNLLIKRALYLQLEQIIEKESIFTINYSQYTANIRAACSILGLKSEGTHGFRWNFAQNRIIEYQNAGHNYRDALQMVSREMKHERPDITCHYTG